MRPRSRTRFHRHSKGQDDHVDAWLMSYADMITLLFMLFAIFVSVSATRHEHADPAHGEPPHPWITEHFGMLSRGVPHDAVFASLTGVVESQHADQNVAVEKTARGLRIDMSAVQFFVTGSADIPQDQLPLIKNIARTLKTSALGDDMIEVAGYTDDEPLQNGKFANNWELAAMRAARVVSLLEEAGIEPSRLSATSHASTRPVVPNADGQGHPIPENRERNQRVVITVEPATP